MNRLQRITAYLREKKPIFLGGHGKIVQIDETMLNHRIKSHRGRAPRKQTWALVIVDCSFKQAKGWVKLIEDKSSKSIMPLIQKLVNIESTIYTDEAKVYQQLDQNESYNHKSIIHKYNFVDYKENSHIQTVESYNNKIKLKIKEMKGIKAQF